MSEYIRAGVFVVRAARACRFVTRKRLKWEAALEINSKTLSRTSRQGGIRRD